MSDFPISKKIYYSTIASICFFALGFVSRQFWILSKIGATPTWIFYVTAIAIVSYTLLTILADTGKAKWLNFIKPAGTATLTCYLIPYVMYGFSDVTGVILPDFLTHGIMGLLNSITFALLVIGITWLLGKIGIKLKI